ncbi:MAG: hypothetical protein ABH879_07835 [archaeon]
MNRITAVVMLLVLYGCSSIDASQAEAVARAFVGERVKFFAVDEAAAADVPNYEITDAVTERYGTGWKTTIDISGTMGDDTRSAKVYVVVDRRGNVAEFFDGKEIHRI